MKMDDAYIGLCGAGTALVTPFSADGSVDVPAFETLVKSQVEEGINFLCVLGTTAETPTLSEEEQHVLRETAVRVVGETCRAAGHQPLPLLLGFGGNDTAGMLRRMKADTFDGMDALLIVTPYYNKPSQEGLYRHYRTLAEASPLPVVLYNVPSRTGVNLTADTTLRLARDCSRIIGIKEASGNIPQIERILYERPEGFKVLSGDDKLTPQLMAMGADGVVSVLSNLFPREVIRLVNRMDCSVGFDFSQWCDLLFAEGSPAGVKAALSLVDKCDNVLRLPLVPVSDGLADRMRSLLRNS